MKLKKIIKHLLICILALLALTALLFTITNLTVLATTSADIYDPEDFSSTEKYDYILVLGAGVRNGEPSPALRDRLDTAIKLYEDGACNKLLMSGDRQNDDYDEVGAMLSYAVSKGVPENSIELDHKGFSTYESMYRAKTLYEADSILIVTQGYHLPRAVYIAECLGMSADGVSADMRQYRDAMIYNMREIAARTKDFFKCVFKPEVN